MLVSFPRTLRLAFFVTLCIGCSACGGEQSTSYGLDWLTGAESRFDARVEGTLDGTFAGQAHFRTNAEGQLVGLELVHGSDSTRGLSIEMEPREPVARTYEVVPSSLMNVERPGSPVGFVAYYEDGQRSFTAVRGSLVLESVETSVVTGTFTLEMDSRVGPNQPAQDDLTLTGSFTATPLD